MRSFLSVLLFGLVLLLNGTVDAHVHHPNDASAPISAKPAITIVSKEQGFASRENESSSLRGLSLMVRRGNSHRSLGGGVVIKSSSGKQQRTLMQQQEWARDDEGNIIWWVWLIIGLSIALCCFVCCCSSACCLRD